jgi:hypothetical protein
MKRVDTAPVVASGLVGGFAVARYSGRRELGGIVLGSAGAWSAWRWLRSGGPGVMGLLLGTYLAAFGVSHPLAQAAAQAVREAGGELVLRPWSSSNINVAYEFGLDGIVHDDPERGGGRGTADEWVDVAAVLTGFAADCRMLELVTA